MSVLMFVFMVSIILLVRLAKDITGKGGNDDD